MSDNSNSNISAEIANGDAITLVNVARQFDVAPSTCLRWILRGLPDGRGGRVHLEAVRRGKPWLTSRAALTRFFGALPHSAAATTPSPIRTPTRRERDVDRARETLRSRYGI